MSADAQSPTLVPWEIALVRAWRKLAVTLAAALAVASVIWQFTHPGLA